MTRPLRLPGGRVAIGIITIFAIMGTLSSCGRYGKPVRAVVPQADTIAQSVEPVAVKEDSSADAKAVDESSDQSE